MSKHRVEIILKVGAAGGSLTLLGSKSPDGQWDYFIERDEAMMFDLMSEEDRKGVTPESQTPYMHSIEEALHSLCQFPWFKLFPMEIHPEFNDRILAEVRSLGGDSAVERWEEHLKRSSVFHAFGGNASAANIIEEAPMKERKIVVYGHGDKRPGFGFPTDQDFEQWIKEDIFTKNRGRYHYTIGMNADVIILSRKGLARGHFEVLGKEKPDPKDYQDYPEVKFVYVVRSSALYGNPVRLSELGIKNIHFGKVITEKQFGKIKQAAGEIQEYRR